MKYYTDKLRPEHLPAVVAIHLEAFPGFFLCLLGRRFLLEFYRSFLEDPVGLAFVALDSSGALLGSAVGPVDPRGYFGRLVRRRWWAFALASAHAALRSPSCIPRLARALRYRGEPVSDNPRALLSSISVLPSAQGKGVGAVLVKRWTQEAWARGAEGCYLTTDAVGNDQVNRFYQQLGWSIEHTYVTREGRKMNRYTFEFAPAHKSERELMEAVS